MKIYPVFIPHAGCPHRCLFCAQDQTASHLAVAGAGDVETLLEELLPLQGDGEVAFYGGTFTLLPPAQQERYLAAARRFVAAGRVAGIRISTRPDALAGRCPAGLRAAGVTTVEIGCQSFSDVVLTASDRGHTAADNSRAIRNCRNAGLSVGVQLMPGLPGSDAAEALRSLRRALTLEPAFLRIYPLVVVAGTALAELWRSGAFIPWSLELAVDVCADMLHLCHQAALPVIRLGLQSDPQLEKNFLAGPYHPAFGQLVRSRLWRRALLHAGKPGGQLTVNPHDLSDALGYRRENLAWLQRAGTAICLATDKAVERGCLSLSGQQRPYLELSAQGGHYG